MEQQILRAVIKMLEERPADDIKEFKASVRCAKLILEELVTKPTPIPVSFKDVVPEKKKPEQTGPQPELVVENGLFKTIKNFNIEDEIIFNGKRMKAKDAIGKQFQTVEMI